MEGSYFTDRFLPGENEDFELEEYVRRWNCENPGREEENPYLRDDVRREIFRVLSDHAVAKVFCAVD